MAWFCSLCRHPSEMVLTAKYADIHDVGVGDICFSCIRVKAEEQSSMEKMDMIGIGYTMAVLDENALQLINCPKCHKYRDTVLVGKPSDMCPSCFNFYLYQNGYSQE